MTATTFWGLCVKVADSRDVEGLKKHGTFVTLGDLYRRLYAMWRYRGGEVDAVSRKSRIGLSTAFMKACCGAVAVAILEYSPHHVVDFAAYEMKLPYWEWEGMVQRCHIWLRQSLDMKSHFLLRKVPNGVKCTGSFSTRQQVVLLLTADQVVSWEVGSWVLICLT